MMRSRQLLLALVFCIAWQCQGQTSGSTAMAHVIVYRTKADYRNLVPVELSADKKTIVSFPGPGDIKTGSGYPLPVLLHKGYLLDRRGVGPNTGFLNLTYKEYAALKALPTPEEMYKLLKDKDPFVSLCDCGVRSAKAATTTELNRLIDKHLLLKKCVKLGFR